MGLDQYLYQKKYIGGSWAENKEDEFVVVKKGEREIRIKIADIEAIDIEVAYWRKNYAINNFFLDKCGNPEDDNCVYMSIKHEDVIELRDILADILSKKTTKEKLDTALKRLPTDDLEEYFESYLTDFNRSLNVLNKLINSKDFYDHDLYYYIWY